MTSEVETALLNATRICHSLSVGWSMYSSNCNYPCLPTGEPGSVPFHYVPPIRAFLWRVVHSVFRPFRLFLTSEDALQHATNLISRSVLTKEVMISLLYPRRCNPYKRFVRRSFTISSYYQRWFSMLWWFVWYECLALLLIFWPVVVSFWIPREVFALREVQQFLNKRITFRIYRRFHLLYAVSVIVLNFGFYYPHCCSL